MKQYTLLTASGINKLLKTASDGSKIALKEVVVSDFEGELSEQTASIPNEKYRGAINAVTINENDNNILDVDAIIPPEIGGFYIKTAGIYCDDGSLFAVARLADTYKPLLNEGSSKDITLNFKLQIANASESVILKVDNNIVLATRKWCEKMFLKLKDKIDAYTKSESDDKFALKTELTDGLPIGAYLSYPSQKTIPAGFLTCDGRSLKKEEYAELFDVIGHTYGGSEQNFNLPNFADGKFMRGIGGNAAALGVVQQDAIRNITGTLPPYDAGAMPSGGEYGVFKSHPGGGPVVIGAQQTRWYYTFDASRVVPTANENRPLNMAVVVIIKAKNVNTPIAGQIDKTILASETKAGITKLKNAITAKQEDAAVTEKAVAEAIEANKGLGIGQAWQDVKRDRKQGVIYTNATGRAIIINVAGAITTSSSEDVQLFINGVLTQKINIGNRSGYIYAVVPAGATYKVTTSANGQINPSSFVWMELR